MKRLVLPILLIAGCSKSDDLDELRKLSDVQIKVAAKGKESKVRVFHVADWHFVEPDHFKIDQEEVEGRKLDEAEIDRRYKRFLDEVEAVQIENEKLLRHLVEKQSVRRVFVEGLTNENLADAKLVMTMFGDTPKDRLADPDVRPFLLKYGAAFWLAVEGKVEVAPLDDKTTLAAASPIRPDGTLRIDFEKIERRQKAQIRRLLNEDGSVAIILGESHDLSHEIRRLSGGAMCYVAVSRKGS